MIAAVVRARWTVLASAVVTIGIAFAGCAPAVDDPTRLGGADVAIGGLPATPPMGWNSWNTFGCGITEEIVRAQADALVSSGLRDAGYTYVVVDDCWMAPTRTADSRLQADPVRFPSGMAALADYMHARGLKFGIYAGARGQTCAQYTDAYPGETGSGGHEQTDAQTFAGWGVDFLKYDWCSADTAHDTQVSAFTTMRDALRATGRPIVYSINPNSGVAGSVPGAEFDWGGVATMTRATNDITSTWSTGAGPSGYQGITDIVDAVAPLGSRVGPGAFLDPDMLVVGVGDTLTPADERTQMSMWAMLAAPLMAGNDLTTMSERTRAALADAGVIGIDQDPRVQAGAPVGDDPEIFSRALGDKGLVVSLTNRDDHPRTMSVALADLGLTGDTVVGVDAWTGVRHQASGGRLSVEVGVHDTALLRIE